MPLSARILSALILAAFAGSATAGRDDSWTRHDDVGSDPITKITRETYDLSPTGRVEAREIGSEVEVRAGSGSKVELVYERRAPTQRDMDCETLRVEPSADVLRIRLDHKREKGCKVVRADDKLLLTVPKGASVELESIGDKVTVTGVEGLVRLSSIGDTATLIDVQQVDADSIGDTIKLQVRKIGAAGIRLESIGDSVDLTLPEDIDARLRIDSVGDEIRVGGLRVRDDEDEHDYDGVFGKGGPTIKIDSVGDSVVIRGPRVGKRDR